MRVPAFYVRYRIYSRHNWWYVTVQHGGNAVRTWGPLLTWGDAAWWARRDWLTEGRHVRRESPRTGEDDDMHWLNRYGRRRGWLKDRPAW